LRHGRTAPSASRYFPKCGDVAVLGGIPNLSSFSFAFFKGRRVALFRANLVTGGGDQTSGFLDVNRAKDSRVPGGGNGPIDC
jgi:hypothetical protein